MPVPEERIEKSSCHSLHGPLQQSGDGVVRAGR